MSYEEVQEYRRILSQANSRERRLEDDLAKAQKVIAELKDERVGMEFALTKNHEQSSDDKIPEWIESQIRVQSEKSQSHRNWIRLIENRVDGVVIGLLVSILLSGIALAASLWRETQ